MAGNARALCAAWNAWYSEDSVAKRWHARAPSGSLALHLGASADFLAPISHNTRLLLAGRVLLLPNDASVGPAIATRLPDASLMLAAHMLDLRQAGAVGSGGTMTQLYVTLNGSVLPTGWNTDSQLGLGTYKDSGVDEMPYNLSVVGGVIKQVAGGNKVSCFVRQDGAVACVGSHGAGLMGSPPPSEGHGLSPTQALRDTGHAGAAWVSVVEKQAAIVRTDGTVSTIGLNVADPPFDSLGYGGTPRTGQVPEFTRNLSLPARAHVTTLGGRYGCAILETTALYCWGQFQIWPASMWTFPAFQAPVFPMFWLDGFPTSPQPVTQVAAIAGGNTHTILLMLDHTVASWGLNQFGETFIPVDATGSYDALRVLPVRLPFLDSLRVQHIAAGNFHSCFTTEAGHLVCAGMGAQGQLGKPVPDADSLGLPAPMQQVNIAGRFALAVTAGMTHTCVYVADGATLCIGGTQISALAGDATVVPPGYMSSYLQESSSGTKFQPVSTVVSDAVAVALPVDLYTPAKLVAAGGEHVCIVLHDDTLTCMGKNTMGQLGLGHTLPISHSTGARRVPLPATPIQVAPAMYHTCVLLDTQQVYCWGGNQYRQCGYADSTDPVLLPYRVQHLLLGVDKVVATDSASCALLTNASVMCWGSNSFGLLAVSALSSISAPSQPVSLNCPVIDVALASNAACALCNDGSVRCWGSDLDNGLGVHKSVPADNGDFYFPLRADIVGNFTALSAGRAFFCGILDDGQLQCWGENSGGQLCVGDILPRSAEKFYPVHDRAPLDPGATVKQLHCGGRHVCVLLAPSNKTVCAGLPTEGQLGDPGVVDPEAFLFAGRSVKLPETARQVVGGESLSCALLLSGTVMCWGSNAYLALGIDLNLQSTQGPTDSMALERRHRGGSLFVPGVRLLLMPPQQCRLHTVNVLGTTTAVMSRLDYSKYTDVDARLAPLTSANKCPSQFYAKQGITEACTTSQTGGSGVVPFAYPPRAPNISAQSSGPLFSAGGTRITLTGDLDWMYATSTAVVLVNGRLCSQLRWVSDFEQARCQAPAGMGSTVEVRMLISNDPAISGQQYEANAAVECKLHQCQPCVLSPPANPMPWYPTSVQVDARSLQYAEPIVASVLVDSRTTASACANVSEPCQLQNVSYFTGTADPQGGTLIHVIGRHFGDWDTLLACDGSSAMEVTVGGEPCELMAAQDLSSLNAFPNKEHSVSDTLIMCRAPATPAAAPHVVVRLADQRSAELQVTLLQYAKPTVLTGEVSTQVVWDLAEDGEDVGQPSTVAAAVVMHAVGSNLSALQMVFTQEEREVACPQPETTVLDSHGQPVADPVAALEPGLLPRVALRCAAFPVRAFWPGAGQWRLNVRLHGELAVVSDQARQDTTLTVIGAPAVSRVEPSSLSSTHARNLVISGFNMGGQGTLLDVLVADEPCRVLSNDSTQIKCTAPARVGSPTLQVRTKAGSASMVLQPVHAAVHHIVPWLVIPCWQLDAVQPCVTQFELQGSGLGLRPDLLQVAIGNASIDVVQASDLTAAVQLHGPAQWPHGQSQISVLTGRTPGVAAGEQTAAQVSAFFSVPARPRIDQVEPAAVERGSAFTIQGEGFGATIPPGLAWPDIATIPRPDNAESAKVVPLVSRVEWLVGGANATQHHVTLTSCNVYISIACTMLTASQVAALGAAWQELATARDEQCDSGWPLLVQTVAGRAVGGCLQLVRQRSAFAINQTVSHFTAQRDASAHITAHLAWRWPGEIGGDITQWGVVSTFEIVAKGALNASASTYTSVHYSPPPCIAAPCSVTHDIQVLSSQTPYWVRVRAAHPSVSMAGPWSAWVGPLYQHCAFGSEYLDDSLPQDKRLCKACPLGRVCPGGTGPDAAGIATLGLLAGYALSPWQGTVVSDGSSSCALPSLRAVPCSEPSLCPGRGSKPRVNASTWTACQLAASAAASVSGIGGQELCEHGSAGTLCSSCLPGYQRGLGAGCVACPSQGLAVLLLGLSVLIAAVMVAWFAHEAARQAQAVLHDRISAQCQGLIVAVYQRIGLAHLQVIGMLTQADLTWPSPMDAVLSAFGLTGSASDAVVSADCLLVGGSGHTLAGRATYARLVAACMLPILVGLLLSVVHMVRHARALRGTYKLFLPVATTWVMVANIFYMPVTRTALELFACTNVGPEGAERSVLVADFDVPCEAPTAPGADGTAVPPAMQAAYEQSLRAYHQLLAWQLLGSLPTLLLVTVGVPAGIVWILRKHRDGVYRAAQAAADSLVSVKGGKVSTPGSSTSRDRPNVHMSERVAAFSVIFLGFRPHRATYYEAALLLRRASWAAGLVLCRSAGYQLQLVVGILVLLASLLIHARNKPYAHQPHNRAEDLHLLTSCASMALALLLEPSWALSSTVRVAASSVIAVLNVGMVLWCGRSAVVALYSQKALQGARLSSCQRRTLSMCCVRKLQHAPAHQSLHVAAWSHDGPGKPGSGLQGQSVASSMQVEMSPLREATSGHQNPLSQQAQVNPMVHDKPHIAAARASFVTRPSSRSSRIRTAR